MAATSASGMPFHGTSEYLQQLGRIIDVLDWLIGAWPAGAPDSGPVWEFARLRDDIEAIKARQVAKEITDLVAMKRRDPDEFQRLADEYQRLAAELRKAPEQDSGD